MLALIPIRDGEPPAGADETLAECGGVGWLVGSGTGDVDLSGLATRITDVDLGDFEVARWADALAILLTDDRPDDSGADAIVLPHSPDGRDLAPRLAVALDRPLFAACAEVTPERVTLIRRGGREEHTMHPQRAFVATLQPGVRGIGATDHRTGAERGALSAPVSTGADGTSDARVVEVLPPDLSTIDLSEARHIVGGGAGLDDAARFPRLAEFAAAIGGSMGATRVVTDRSWVPHDKQIGTTGVVVDPDLYVSFGISGAVQHTAGLGAPDHIISVNTDPHCPMMQMSDLAIVADANETLEALHDALVERRGDG